MNDKILIDSQLIKSKNRSILLEANLPKVSIIQTVRSSTQSNTQLASISSIINQTYSNWELIIVNDGGNLDGLVQDPLITKHISKIKIINCRRIGRANALNIGLKNSTGQFVSYLDHDNFYDNHFLEVMVYSALENDSDFIYCAQLRFSDEGTSILFYKNITKKDILKYNKIDINAVLHKRIIGPQDNYNIFDPRLTRLIDWAAFLKFLSMGIKFKSLPFIGSYYFDGQRNDRISNNDEFEDNFRFISTIILDDEFNKNTIKKLTQSCNFCSYVGTDFRSAGTQSTVFEINSVRGGGFRANNLCPCCGSFDRHRSMNFIISEIITAKQLENILHIAPEKLISDFLISKLPNSNIIAGDKFPESSNILSIDITKLRFDNEFFDLIVCSHVLEHVKDDDIAISELFRVLRPGGIIIAPIPYSEIIYSSISEPRQVNYSKEKRLSLFGQEDHVRLYEKDDYISKFKKSGFHHINYDESIFNNFNANACEMFVFQKPLSTQIDKIASVCNEDILPFILSRDLGGWALEKDLVQLIDILSSQLAQPLMVEFGSGKGSKSLAYIMKKHKGRMYSIESDDYWASLVDNELTENDLSDYSQVLLSPLSEIVEFNIPSLFYSKTFLDYIDNGINLVVIDGPKGTISPIARYPALPMIFPKLDKDKFFIILDDYNRVDEKIIVELWKLNYKELYFLPLKLEKKQICVVSNICLEHFFDDNFIIN